MMHTPKTPSPAYLNILAAESDAARVNDIYTPAEHVGAPAPLRQTLNALVEQTETGIRETVKRIHAQPETAFEERFAAQHLAALIEAEGVTVEKGAHTLETALRAETCTENFDPAHHPTIAILAEYDALPGIGHACGHNVIAAAAFGAFTALHRLFTEENAPFDGRVVFLGTPAEEGRTGKEYMARAGAFTGVDAAIMVHPYTLDLADQVWLGRRTLQVTFTGRAAHASAQPFMGINALDAASLAYQGIGLLRQQTPPSDRIHAVITEGGQRPSIIVEKAQLNLYVRSKYPEALRILSERIEDVMRGAALMTGAGYSLSWDSDPASLPVRTNSTLTDRWVIAQRERGREPLPKTVVSDTIAASTDFGNVSYRLPGAHPLIKIAPENSALHTREFADAAGSDDALRGAVDAAYGLAATALDFLYDPAITRAVQQEFAAAGGAVDVETYFTSSPEQEA